MPADGAGYVSANNTKFYNNVVGLYIANNAGHRIRANTFEYTSVLKAPYSGQFIHRQIPFAGIVFNNAGVGIVGSISQSDKNTFKYLSVGIVSHKTNLSCIGNEFLNLYGQVGYYDLDDFWKGSGDNIFILGGSNHNISKNIFSNNQGCMHVRKMIQGEINIFRNKVVTPSAAFNFTFNSNVDIKLFEHKDTYFTGSKIEACRGFDYDISNSNCNIDIFNNDFNSNKLNGIKSIYSIDIASDQSNSHIYILNN